MNHPYADFVHLVDKPARYLGGEYQAARKDWSTVEVRFCLAFPDIYDIGMSHLGTKILYSLLNRSPKIACERAFAPWPDMERELRARGLPLLSLESARPLSDFDAIGCSLQYELTWSNVLTLLDLGGVPLRAADRGEEHPIVWAGGPTATHPEPVAPFFDCILVGEAEEALPALLLLDAEHKRQGLPRRERLVRLAQQGGVYVPSLYATRYDARSRREVVDRALDPRAPLPITRNVVADLNRFPFPDDTPVPWAEAVFDRVSVEIARGCTEGCRFCQAGMIYRPVRERDPDAIVEALVGAIQKGGYDEASLTSLSTADFSCVTPLVKRVARRLREDKVSLSVSSLRAYGLGGELLDEIARVRAGGLTFAPEAGTQRMRDVINKNVTEEDITRSAENVFSRGFSRMKLYFMIGLPTEEDDDVRGIVQTGGRLKRHGKRIRRDAEVTVSVSSHVPKPHTPFQWCRMDTIEELTRKQRVLRDVAQREKVDLKWHDTRVSFVEGIFSRGDRRLAEVLESAWRAGARFDGWEEQLKLPLWERALAAHGVDPRVYLDALPEDGRLPWDHLDIGLEDGFLLREWRKAAKSKGSPPCGKPSGSLLHHATVEDAEDDERRLVCYDCGVACDLDHMREQRIVYLKELGAHRPPAVALRVVTGAEAGGQDPEAAASAEPASERAEDAPVPPLEPARPALRQQQRPRAAFEQGEGTRYRLEYTKLGRAAFISHLDTSRLLQRLLRRAGVRVCYSQGFHPKPDLAFGPALALGVAALAEVVDVRLDEQPVPEALRARLEAAAPEGVRVSRAARLGAGDAGVNRLITLADWAALVPAAAAAGFDPAAPPAKVVRVQKGVERPVDVARHLVAAGRASPEEAARLRARLEWPEGDGAILVFTTRIQGDGGVKPAEVVQSLLGQAPAGLRLARLGLFGGDEQARGDLFPGPAAASPRPARRATAVAVDGAEGDESAPALVAACAEAIHAQALEPLVIGSGIG